MPKKMVLKKSSKNGAVSLETVERVAKIAKLNLTEGEKKKYVKDLSEILASFRNIKTVKANVPPSFHPLDVRDVFRNDEVEKCLSRGEALKNTKHKEDGFFKGPKAV
jgi:aspartyl-tRNA(Asn)/glutamyl-tRNA(Gln) amidotransferase subunit C